jgi:hypothetical protein
MGAVPGACYHWTDAEKDKWMNQGFSQQEVCNSVPGRLFTGGNNTEYPGCGDCWCCTVAGKWLERVCLIVDRRVSCSNPWPRAPLLCNLHALPLLLTQKARVTLCSNVLVLASSTASARLTSWWLMSWSNTAVSVNVPTWHRMCCHVVHFWASE